MAHGRQNDEAKKNKKKLTAAERRRIEREQRSRYSDLDDDPYAAFNIDVRVPKDEFDSMSYLFGEDDSSGGFSNDAPDPSENRGEAAGRITPASTLTRRQRKMRMIISYIGVFFVIVAVTILLSLTVMFRTTEIRVNAEGLPYSDEEVIEASGLSMKDNIFLAKRKAAEKKLVEGFPYIEGADVTFRIPGTQIISIDVAVPSYQVQFSGGFAVVSANCRILEVNPNQRSDIPLLKGIKLNHTTPGEYITFEKNSTKQILDEVVKNINENDIGRIYGIDISNAANIELNYDNRITILLGLPEDVGYKLRTAKAIIEKSLTPTEKGTLDVSLANSDRRSSYFTPIYSDTVSSAPSSAPAESASDTASSNAENDYLDDIID